MSAIIQVGNSSATLDLNGWKSNNKNLEKTLNILRRPNWNTPSQPKPILTLAQNSAKVLGGKLLHADPEPEDHRIIY